MENIHSHREPLNESRESLASTITEFYQTLIRDVIMTPEISSGNRRNVFKPPRLARMDPRSQHSTPYERAPTSSVFVAVRQQPIRPHPVYATPQNYSIHSSSLLLRRGRRGHSTTNQDWAPRTSSRLPRLIRPCRILIFSKAHVMIWVILIL